MDQGTKMTAQDRINSMYAVLDKLGDLPEGGRIKCGYVWVMNDLLTGLQNDIKIMQEKLNAQNQTVQNSEPKIVLEEVTEDEESSIFDEDIG